MPTYFRIKVLKLINNIDIQMDFAGKILVIDCIDAIFHDELY